MAQLYQIRACAMCTVGSRWCVCKTENERDKQQSTNKKCDTEKEKKIEYTWVLLGQGTLDIVHRLLDTLSENIP